MIYAKRDRRSSAGASRRSRRSGSIPITLARFAGLAAPTAEGFTPSRRPRPCARAFVSETKSHNSRAIRMHANQVLFAPTKRLTDSGDAEREPVRVVRAFVGIKGQRR